jgi:hypothetical protein
MRSLKQAFGQLFADGFHILRREEVDDVADWGLKTEITSEVW